MPIFSIWYGVDSAIGRTRGMEEKVESLPEALCYKQRLEKSTGAEMFLMKWSPVADLLAAAYTDHSVSVQRDTGTAFSCIILMLNAQIVKVL